MYYSLSLSVPISNTPSSPGHLRHLNSPPPNHPSLLFDETLSFYQTIRFTLLLNRMGGNTYLLTLTSGPRFFLIMRKVILLRSTPLGIRITFFICKEKIHCV